MKSYVMVFDHPFFATTAKDGTFEIKGVPAGTQNLVLWQEKVGYASPGQAGRGMPVTVVRPESVVDVGEVKLDSKKVKPRGLRASSVTKPTRGCPERSGGSVECRRGSIRANRSALVSWHAHRARVACSSSWG